MIVARASPQNIAITKYPEIATKKGGNFEKNCGNPIVVRLAIIKPHPPHSPNAILRGPNKTIASGNMKVWANNW